MRKRKIIQSYPFPISQRSLVFLLNEKKVLLAEKVRGFGEGLFLGIGGKFEIGDGGIEETAIRETQEEVGVKLDRDSLKFSALLHFRFSSKPEWNQDVWVYTTQKWEGKPRNTKEMRPHWFNVDTLPLNEMWDDAKYWLPLVLQGKVLEAHILYGNECKIVQEVKLTLNYTMGRM